MIQRIILSLALLLFLGAGAISAYVLMGGFPWDVADTPETTCPDTTALEEQSQLCRDEVEGLRNEILILQGELERLDANGAVPEPPGGSAQGQRMLMHTLGSDSFVPGSDILSGPAAVDLSDVATRINSRPEIFVRVIGHTDNEPLTGENLEEYGDNMTLSLRRAATVAASLVKDGVGPERIYISGFGDTRPRTANTTPEGRAENRRVEIWVGTQ